MESVSLNPLLATFQLSSTAYLNLGRSENGVLGNGLIFLFGLKLHLVKVKRKLYFFSKHIVL